MKEEGIRKGKKEEKKKKKASQKARLEKYSA